MQQTFIKRIFIVVYKNSLSKNNLEEHSKTWRKKYLSKSGVLIIFGDNEYQKLRWHPLENETINAKKGFITSNDDYTINEITRILRATTENSIYEFEVIEEIFDCKDFLITIM